MREIKFRAWHKEKKLMYRLLSLVLAQREQEATLIGYGTTLVRYERPYVTCHLDEIELMQYTGIKDKNGKDIYGGDIVINYHNKFRGVVFFERGCFWVRELFTHVDDGVYDGDSEKETRWSIDLDYEIIGNIYENPELVEAQ